MRAELEHRKLVPGTSCWYAPHFFDAARAEKLGEELRTSLIWRRDKIRVFGKTHAIPRLHALYGDEGLHYKYSNIVLKALPWNEALLRIVQDVNTVTGGQFNSVLCNLYRDGNDCNGWHADDEQELGLDPIIASLSFGAARVFQLKHRKNGERIDIDLQPGSLLYMGEGMQIDWLHSLPRRKRCKQWRVNLTFRKIIGGIPRS